MAHILRHVSGAWAALMLAAFTAGAVPTSAGSASAAGNTNFSGQAKVISGTVLGVAVNMVDTGPVAPEGGALGATLLEYPIPGLPDATGGALSAEVLSAAVVAGGHRSSAEASVASVGLNAAGQRISSEFLRAEAEARCADGKAFVKGGSDVVELVVNGQTIEVTGEVNQRIDLPGGGFVIVNEQLGSAEADRGDITVNALHVVIPGLLPGTDTDLVVAQAHADIRCGPPPACNKDFVTGGGFLPSPKRHFAVAGGVKNNGFWGHLTYMDRAANLKVKGTGVTAYAATGPTSRHIEGNAEINGSSGWYRVDASDNGEPGRNDTFAIQLSNGYTAEGTLAGGNIQLHTCTR